MYQMTLDLPDEVGKRYAELARHTGRLPEEVMAEVLQTYLDQVAEDTARLEEAIAAADRGETVDAEVVHAEAEALIAQSGGVSLEQRAPIRAEVRAEMERAYGVTLCR